MRSVGLSVVTEYSLRLGFSVLVGLSITAGFVLLVWEYLSYPGRWRAARRNMLLSLSALGPNFLTFLIIAPYWAVVYFTLAEWVPRTIELSAISVAAAFVACDLSYYVEHRCGHKVRFLWRLHHGTHHHSDLYNIPLAYRVNFLTQLTTPLFYIPWLIVGFHPLLIVGFQVFVLHYQAWIHTESIGRLGVLDKLINTPAVHRMHHSRDPRHQAVNLGGVMLLWDHLFGTYCAPQDQVQYGVAGAAPTSTFFGIYRDPWKR